MMMNYTEKTNNYNAGRKFIVVEANDQRWKKKNNLINANCTQEPSVALLPRIIKENS
jgi:hypothetical protein